MNKQDRQTREQIGCGYEQLVQIKTSPWSPASVDSNWLPHSKDLEITVCPGYTMTLPEVREIARARVHAKELGGLRDFCDETPTDRLREGVEILEGNTNECQAWAMDHPVKAGA